MEKSDERKKADTAVYRIRAAVIGHLHRPAMQEDVIVRGERVGIGASVTVAKQMLTSGRTVGDIILAIRNVREPRKMYHPMKRMYLGYLKDGGRFERAVSHGHKHSVARNTHA